MNSPTIQNLNAFRLPPDFRGRSGLFVQLWWLVQATLFRASPQVMYGFRRWLLRQFGAQIGEGARIRPSVTIPYPWKLQIGDYSWVGDDAVLYCFARITIGKNAVVSQKSYLCAGTHDYRSVSFDIQALPIVIEDEAWLAADVFIAPGVTVGRGAVVGSRSSVFSDLPPMMVCVGSPARPVHSRRAEP
ncbi:MAG TPA: putative colanic acid biosynthesis acetyltransferase [Steroidobacteraceae bacterium]|nr:putative colanic acid biosynthesis acetyltransferase [Steroidobacteraceae bacterium]